MYITSHFKIAIDVKTFIIGHNKILCVGWNYYFKVSFILFFELCAKDGIFCSILLQHIKWFYMSTNCQYNKIFSHQWLEIVITGSIVVAKGSTIKYNSKLKRKSFQQNFWKAKIATIKIYWYFEMGLLPKRTLTTIRALNTSRYRREY